MNKGKWTYVSVGFLCILVLILIIIAGISTGPSDYSIQEILFSLNDVSSPIHDIIFSLRFPRVLLALITGCVLTLGGFFMQALIKNPLADPYIMGVTAGAGLGVNLLILGLIPIAQFTIFTYPLFAALGAMVSLFVVVLLGFKSLLEDNAKLLIAGVAVASLFTALTGVLIYTIADSDQIRQVIFWTFGSFHKATWEAVSVSVCLLFFALIYAFVNARSLDILIMGDVDAQSLGMHVKRLKISLLIVTSIVVGGTVAFTGPIGFVGMIIPHFSRSILGVQHRPNVILGSLMGGSFLAACDILSQHILPPAGLPIGIITSILGVPFFLYILFAKANHL